MKSPLLESETLEQRLPRRVIFLILPNVQLLDLAGPAQVFDAASQLGASYTLQFCAASPEVRSAQQLHLARLESFPDSMASSGISSYDGMSGSAP